MVSEGAIVPGIYVQQVGDSMCVWNITSSMALSGE